MIIFISTIQFLAVVIALVIAGDPFGVLQFRIDTGHVLMIGAVALGIVALLEFVKRHSVSDYRMSLPIKILILFVGMCLAPFVAILAIGILVTLQNGSYY